jgi:hypothetical protein
MKELPILQGLARRPDKDSTPKSADHLESLRETTSLRNLSPDKLANV